MRYVVFSVFDAIAGAFLPPQHCRSKGEAIRMFSDAVNASDHQFNKHANDYVLFALGQWDDDTGLYILSKEGPERILTGRDVLNKDPGGPSN